MTALTALLLLITVLALVLVAGWVLVRTPLSRVTVDRFARRQHVALTDSNATHVVATLTVSHRWRRVGLVVGLLLGVVWSLRQGELTLYFLAGFLGWFAGAVIAQWRISRLDGPGDRRAAALAPRGITTYLTPLVRILGGGTLGLAVAAAATALVRAGVSVAWTGWALYLGAVVAVLVLTARAIVERPSGFVDTAVRDADDALRCHGLTVLAGAGIAAAYPAIVAFVLQAGYPAGVPSSMDPLWTLGVMIVLLALGYWVATGSPSARAGREPEPILDRGAAHT